MLAIALLVFHVLDLHRGEDDAADQPDPAVFRAVELSAAGGHSEAARVIECECAGDDAVAHDPAVVATA